MKQQGDEGDKTEREAKQHQGNGRAVSQKEENKR